MPPETSTPRFWLTLYGWLMRLYPRSMRRQYGRDLEHLFVDLHSEARDRGRAPAAWLAVRACAEIPPRAFQAHGDPDSPTGAYLVRSIFSDLRSAWQTISRQRRHSTVVIATIAIGIGTTTAVFSITDAAILRRLPFPEAHRLVDVAQQHPAGWGLFAHDEAAFVAWGEQDQLFDFVGGYNTTTAVTRIADRPREIDVVEISPEMLPVLGASPVIGRLLVAEDAVEGAAPNALISERIWQQQFAGSVDALDARLTLDGVDHAVVGVLPSTFAFPYARIDVWTATDPTREGTQMRMVGRLAPGLELPTAREMADAVAQGLAEATALDEGWSLSLLTFDEQRAAKRTQTALWVALGAVFMLLVVSIVNVAQVALARAMEREGELSVRSALGAGRSRIVRQVLFENLLLALMGGALGVYLARGLVDLIAAAAPEDLIQIEAIQFGVEWRATAAALALSIAAGVGFGMLPAWTASRTTLATAMQNARRGVTTSRRQRRIQGGLLFAQAALCLVLLAGAGLLMNSFGRLTGVDPGFDAESILSMILQLDEERYATPAARLEVMEQFAARAEALPAVTRATVAAGAAPLPGGVYFAETIQTDAGAEVDLSELGSVLPFGWVSEGYFETLGVEILDGRPITRDDFDTDNVVVSEALARRLFGDSGAVGRRFRIADEDKADDAGWWSIVGVADTIATFGLESIDTTMPFYAPIKSERTPRPYGSVVVRSTGDPAAVVPLLEQALWSIDPQQPVHRVVFGVDKINDWVVEPRFNALLIGTFASVALLLVIVGIGGVVGHAVASRTREIGIRVALGANRRAVLAMASGAGLRPVLAGLLVGGIVVWQTTHLLSSLLFDLQPNDPATLLGAGAVFVLVTGLSSYLPARRALRVDPASALRAE